MAKKEDIELVKVKVLKNLKYNTKIKAIGDELEVNKNDVKEMVDKNLVEILEVINNAQESTTTNATE
ncbi:hypothetical protein [Clostridium sp. DJ247]|uniref:DUF7210 family protein n=1 Tax=Clostridium sp. DJ247 TaxID=2726188 RepID=UPI001623A363|nr:hypothetical protein [Clostridium sp. DJ247]MBC2579989.1 hypothetical protein [Clostridium sp. DJ247]